VEVQGKRDKRSDAATKVENNLVIHELVQEGSRQENLTQNMAIARPFWSGKG
jgi:hypothetical protein